MGAISKEKFCNIIDEIVEGEVAASRINDILRHNTTTRDLDINPYAWFDSNLGTIVTLLETMFDDLDGWTSHWIFECSGDSSKFAAWDVDGKEFFIENSEDLYELIVNDVCKYEKTLG